MPDPLNPAEEFTKKGLAWATSKLARTVLIQKHPYSGIRTETEVQVEGAQYGSRITKKAWTMLIQRPGMAQEDWDYISDGKSVVDDVGKTWWIVGHSKSPTHVTFTCCDTNGVRS